MPTTPKSTDGETPKKRTRKATTAAEDGTKVVKNSKPASNSAKPKLVKAKSEVAAAPAAGPVQELKVAPVAKDVFPMTSLEERIRVRAYELYLRRRGQGGSPEQDWFQAAAEVYGESVA